MIGVNRAPEAVQRLVEAGGQGADSVSEAVRTADVVITMVPDSPDVEGIALGDGGIYANATRGAIQIETVGSTVVLAGNRILDRTAAGMLAGEFQPGFRVDLHHKEMGIVTAAARDKGVVIPLGALTAELVGAARAQGDRHLDHSALLRGAERLSGSNASGKDTDK